MKHQTKAVLQNENDRLRAALADVLDVCGRERRLLDEWPRAVGEVQCIARLALQGAGPSVKCNTWRWRPYRARRIDTMTTRTYSTRVNTNDLLPVVQHPADVRTVWGEVVDDAPPAPIIRIGPAAPTPPNVHEERTARREPDLIPDVIVPALQAFTALSVLAGVGLLAWALGWSWRVPVALGGLAWVVGWLWRLGVADSLLWAVETWSQHDLDGDGIPGKPQMRMPS